MLRSPSVARWLHNRVGQRGSISIELAVLTPGLAILLLLLAAGGRVVEVQGHIDGAARDAARAASLAQTPGEAEQFALQAAQTDLGPTSWCRNVSVTTTGFPAVAGPFTGGAQQVSVTVRCDANMSPFGLLGFQASMPFSGSAVAPLDPFVCRDTAC